MVVIREPLRGRLPPPAVDTLPSDSESIKIIRQLQGKLGFIHTNQRYENSYDPVAKLKGGRHLEYRPVIPEGVTNPNTPFVMYDSSLLIGKQEAVLPVVTLGADYDASQLAHLQLASGEPVLFVYDSNLVYAPAQWQVVNSPPRRAPHSVPPSLAAEYNIYIQAQAALDNEVPSVISASNNPFSVDGVLYILVPKVSHSEALQLVGNGVQLVASNTGSPKLGSEQFIVPYDLNGGKAYVDRHRFIRDYLLARKKDMERKATEEAAKTVQEQVVVGLGKSAL